MVTSLEVYLGCQRGITVQIAQSNTIPLLCPCIHITEIYSKHRPAPSMFSFKNYFELILCLQFVLKGKMMQNRSQP